MTAAKAHPCMVSYLRLGLIEQDRASGRYELGPLALQMGPASMRRLNPVGVATEAIVELALRINQTVAPSAWL
jgi:DNA-binding IclR family transcriptional regulator